MTIADEVRSERLALADYLAGLSPGAWSTASLCPGWTVRDVVAHLTTSTRTSWWDFVSGMVAARGDFEAMQADQARDRAARFDTDQLVDQVRESADDSRRAPFSRPVDVLLDLLVHRQDIARPLGDRYVPPADRVIPALDHAVASRFYGRRHLAGLRLTDPTGDWSTGEGPEVRGPLPSLLLVASGRTASLDELDGPGVETLTRRLT